MLPLALWSLAVHPRVRGEQAKYRGVSRDHARFIPACAGSRYQYKWHLIKSAVHPRVRGEQGLEDLDPGAQQRFIPACAGSRLFSSPDIPGGSVHPRVRGEQVLKSMALSTAAGSSPRARGAGKSTERGGERRRFIPACAGSSFRSSHRQRQEPVHPRVRGEQLILVAIPVPSTGSSPRARGADGPFIDLQLLIRFIPACAGSRGRGSPITSQ